MKTLKTIFLGTPDFALPSLQSLLRDDQFEVIAVVTQADKKIGRKQLITPPPVKQLAQKNGLTVLQPAKLKGNKKFIELVKKLQPDLLIVVAYGQILPKELLMIPKYGAWNVHASLLPKYRGASPIEAALLNGDQETGVSIMQIEEKLDAGAVLGLARITISDNDNAESLTAKLSIIGGQILPHLIKDYCLAELKPIAQNEKNATHCGKISKNDGLIDFHKLTARQILNRILAYTPWPSVFIKIDGKKLKLLEIEIDENKNLKPGTAASPTKNEIILGTKKGAIILKKVQLEGKKPMPIQDFLAGNGALFSKLLTNPK